MPSSTVGYEKRANWGLRTTSEDEFVQMVLDGQPEPPAYFAQMKRINREGPRVLGESSLPARTPAEQLPELLRSTAFVIDLRPAAEFVQAHVPGTLSISYNRSFSTWAGSLVPYDVDVWLIASDADSVARAVHDLSMIGLDRVAGWFDASALRHWTEHVGALVSTEPITVNELAAGAQHESVQILDVRGASEWSAGHIADSRNIPLGSLPAAVSSLDPDRAIVVHCQSGVRSTIAASVLERAGRTDVHNLRGGFAAWREAGHAISHERKVLV